MRLDASDATPRLVPLPPPPALGPACPGSVVMAPLTADTLFAAWWRSRPDSSAVLLVARSDDAGATWRTPVAADSLDRSRVGCQRPPAAITTDRVTGYVLLAYWLEGPEGAGVFFTHSMERGALFHAPVPVLYGDRLSRADLVAHGDTVVVAFEDPNSATPRLGLALSRTSGHIFEARTSIPTPAGGGATAPVVATLGDRVTVAWVQTPRGAGAPEVRWRTGAIRFP